VALLQTERRGATLTITLANVAKRNVLSTELIGDFIDAIDLAESLDEVRVVVVTNQGPVFCAGADLRERSSDEPAPGRGFALPELFQRIRRSPKPFVGRIAGHCVAGGVGLAAAMDIAVAVERATFGFSEVRLGVAPAMISVVCLPKMRRADALASFLRGTRFSAADAASMGLIAASASPEELDTDIDAIVNDLLAGEPAALAAAKELVDRVPDMDVDAAFAWTADLSAHMFASGPAREGMAAFLDKRPASWVDQLPDEPAPWHASPKIE